MPRALESLRELLNTWSIPNDTRVPVDRFTGSGELRALRDDDLRDAVESKRWCLMTAGSPDGRSCESIAKVKAHRQNAAAMGWTA